MLNFYILTIFLCLFCTLLIKAQQPLQKIFKPAKAFISESERMGSSLVLMQSDIVTRSLKDKYSFIEFKAGQEYEIWLRMSKTVKKITVKLLDAQDLGITLHTEIIKNPGRSFKLRGNGNGAVIYLNSEEDFQGFYSLVVTTEGEASQQVKDEIYVQNLNRNCNMDPISNTRFKSRNKVTRNLIDNSENSNSLRSKGRISLNTGKVVHKIANRGKLTFDINNKGCDQNGTFVMVAIDNSSEQVLMKVDLNKREFSYRIMGEPVEDVYKLHLFN